MRFFVLFVFVCCVLLFCIGVDGQGTRKRQRTRGRGGGRRDQCHLREMEACMDKMRQFGKAKNPTEIITTNEGLDKICKTIKEDMLKCSKNFVKKCGTPLHREVFDLMFDQITIRIKRFCDNNDARAEFLKHSPCMHEKVFSQEQYKKTCNNEFLANMNSLDTKVEGKTDDTHSKMCCSFNIWQDCSIGLVKKECGQQAHDSFDNLIGKSFGTLTDMFCPKDVFQSNSKQCQETRVKASDVAKAKGRLGDNAVTKYVTSFFSFLFVTN